MTKPPPLKPLHSEALLIKAKLEMFRKLSTQALLDSLSPGQSGSLKTRPDGTMIDGHHRVKILASRGVDIDSLPWEIVTRK